MGYSAGFKLTTGNNNICIGNQGVAGESGIIRIGTDGKQTECYIAGIEGVNLNHSATEVFIDSDGQLGTIQSSKRYKENINNISLNNKDIKDLRPVEFNYKKDKDKNKQYGLIAEEVEQVLPELVVYNKDNKPESVKYHLLPALLLNELKKQDEKHKKSYAIMLNRIEELNNEILKLKSKR